jgi:hypothetical protein
MPSLNNKQMMKEILKALIVFTVPGFVMFYSWHLAEGYLFYLTGYLALFMIIVTIAFFNFYLQKNIKNRHKRYLCVAAGIFYTLTIQYLLSHGIC